MTQDNPMGGFDLGAMLEQAQAMQAQLMNAQAELAEQTVDGSSGGVQVTVSGTGELVGVRFTPGTFDSSDDESLADLGDLVVAAFRDAKAKADALAQQALGPLAGGLGGGDLGGGLGGLMGGSPGV
jgi:DNA-binding YbaB/EbfC family protein